MISEVASHANHMLLPEIASLSGPMLAIAGFEGVARNKVEYYNSSFNRVGELGVSICIGLEDVSTAI